MRLVQTAIGENHGALPMRPEILYMALRVRGPTECETAASSNTVEDFHMRRARSPPHL